MELCTTQSVSNLPAVLPSSPSRRRLDSSAALRPSLIPGSSRFLSLRNRGFICLPKASFNEESSTGPSSLTTEETDTSASNRFFPPVTAYASADSSSEQETAVETDSSAENRFFPPTNAFSSEDSTAENKAVVETDSSAENKVVTESPATQTSGEESPVSEQLNKFLDNLDIKVDSDDTYYLLLFGGGAVVALWIASAVVGAIDSIPLVPKLLEVVGLGYTVWFTTRYLLYKDSRDEFFAKIEELKQQVLGSTSD